jgi:hypothetical protein
VTAEDERPSRHLIGLYAPLSELPWSDDFVMQAIEVLPVTLQTGNFFVCVRHTPTRSSSAGPRGKA